MKKIRLLVVDDSSLARDLIAEIVSPYDDLVIAGTAENGKEACRMASSLRPDLILMDVHMPVMNGIEATDCIMKENPTPILIVTSDDAIETGLSALAMGALDVVLKPSIDSAEDSLAHRMFIKTIRNLAGSAMKQANILRQPAAAPAGRGMPGTKERKYGILGIASSTGGPGALRVILPGIQYIDIPVLVTQHLGADFADPFIAWIGKDMVREISFAKDGEEITPSKILFAPPGIHLTVTKNRRIRFDDSPPVNFQKPSADLMFSSMAEAYGNKAMGVILTGMGKDGARGMLALKEAGGCTLAQDEQSCVVYGMPKAAVEINAVGAIVELQKMTEAIINAMI